MLNRAAQFFRSLSLTLFLLAALIFACLLGVFIPQGRPIQEYLSAFGETGFRFLHFFWLTDVFKSFWFKGLWLCLAAQLFWVIIAKMREQRREWGFIIVHLGLLTVIAGGFVSGFGRILGTLKLEKGQSSEIFLSRGKEIPLGFRLQLEDFRVEIYPVQESVVLETLGGSLKEFPAFPGQRIDIPELGYQLAVDSQIEQPPSVLIDFKTEDKNFKARVPAGSEGFQFPGGFFKIYYRRLPAAAKAYASKVKVTQAGQAAVAKEIRVNHPLRAGAYSIYQSQFDSEKYNWSEFEVVRDPGTGIVFAGGLVLTAGLFLNLGLPLIQKRIEDAAGKAKGREA